MKEGRTGQIPQYRIYISQYISYHPRVEGLRVTRTTTEDPVTQEEAGLNYL